MAFSQATKETIFQNAHGHCQGKGCHKQIVLNNHNDGERGAWQAHHKTSVQSGGSDTASNGKALCNACHRDTPTYGKHK